MPKPNPNYKECLERIRRAYERRGYRIIRSTNEAEISEPIETRPAENPQTNEGIGEDEGLESKFQDPTNTQARTTRTLTQAPTNPANCVNQAAFSQPLQKLRSVYETIENKALYLSPVLDLTFPGGKEINVDYAGNQKISVGEEAYNSVLLFTTLTAVLDNGKMLFFGPPGSGKTSSSRFVGSAVRNLLVDYIKCATIYGHPEQTEEKMIAMFDPAKMIKGEKQLIIREFLKSPIKVIDEINRLRPESHSILLELLNTGSITYQGQLIKAVPGPLFATANSSDSGNFEIPPPLKDRFDIGVIVDTINPYYFEIFARRRARGTGMTESKICLEEPITSNDLSLNRNKIYAMTFPAEVMGRIAHFIAELTGCDMAGVAIERKTKGNLSEQKPPAICKDCDHYSKEKSICSKTENGLSARALESICTYAKAVAYWRGKNHVGEDDVKAVIPYVTWFRLVPTRAAFELEPRFVNDRISMVEKLYEISSRSYEEIANAMPDYKKMTSLVFSCMNNSRPIKLQGFGVSRKEIEDLIAVAGKLDTCAKYPLITALKKIYNNYTGR